MDSEKLWSHRLLKEDSPSCPRSIRPRSFHKHEETAPLRRVSGGDWGEPSARIRSEGRKKRNPAWERPFCAEVQARSSASASFSWRSAKRERSCCSFGSHFPTTPTSTPASKGSQTPVIVSSHLSVTLRAQYGHFWRVLQPPTGNNS